MANFPDWLYRHTGPKDSGTQQLDIIAAFANNSGLATNVEATVFSVPKDRVLVLSTLHLRASPGAGQTTGRISLWITQPDSGIAYNLAQMFNTSEPDNANFSGQVWVPPGFDVRADANFSAAVNSNSIRVQMTGVTIPRGNMSWQG